MRRHGSDNRGAREGTGRRARGCGGRSSRRLAVGGQATLDADRRQEGAVGAEALVECRDRGRSDIGRGRVEEGAPSGAGSQGHWFGQGEASPGTQNSLR